MWMSSNEQKKNDNNNDIANKTQRYGHWYSTVAIAIDKGHLELLI